MNTQEFIHQKVKEYYWKEDLNCAKTTLKILAEKFNIELSNQVMDAAIGMHGAGKLGAQCGLVEGTLMFLGIAGKIKNIPENEIVDFCHRFAKDFQEHFGSLLCGELRPEGFKAENPPHLCESLTCQGLAFSIKNISGSFTACC